MKSHIITRSAMSIPIQLLVILMGSLIGAQEARAQYCGDGSPARPVAKCVDPLGAPVSCAALDAIRLWPDGFKPGGVNAGTLVPNPIPKSRDTTDRVGGVGRPFADTGFELFRALDVVGDHLYVAYNVGLQVWKIDTNPELKNTGAVTVKDLWRGDFWWAGVDDQSEQYNFIDDVAAINVASGVDLVAAAGKAPGPGVSLWQHDTTLRQIYQDRGTSTQQVSMVEFESRVYAFAAVLDQSNPGITIYDVTAASQLTCTPSCVDDKGSLYPNVHLGMIPGFLARYVDLAVVDGAIFVAASHGFFGPIKIWRLTDPTVPSSAVEIFSGQGTGAKGLAFLPYPNPSTPQKLYLAFVQDDILKILKLGSPCFVPGQACALESCNPILGGPACQIPVSTYPADEQFLTYSMSGSTPYLYFGVSSIDTRGPKIEQLLNLSDLGKTAQQLQQQGLSGPRFPEITDTGGTYTDACNGEEIGYWADYYPRNDKGLRSMNPRVAKFGGPDGAYLYRAAESILDVHVRTNVVVDPTITAAVQSPEPDPETGAFWMGEQIDMVATAQNCTPAGLWAWAESTDLPVAGLASTTSMANLTWSYCPTLPCPDETVSVIALPQSGCGLSPVTLQTPNPLVLKDPRPQILQINTAPDQPSYPAGVELIFTADKKGKSPFSYSWVVKDASQFVIASGIGESFVWENTCSALTSPDRIFTDGFESGNFVAWSEIEGGVPPRAVGQSTWRVRSSVPQSGHGAALAGMAKKQAFSIELTLGNGLPPNAVSSTEITLEAPGPLSFDTPAIIQAGLGGGSFSLRASSQNATEWKWEIEDPNGGGACQVYATCQVFDWGEQGQELVQAWLQTGTFGVTVWARNACAPETALTAASQVQVDQVVAEPLAVTQFRVDSAENGGDCAFSLGFVDCLIHRQITFLVATTGNPTSLKVDWDNTGVFATVPVPATGKLFHAYSSTHTTSRPRIRATKGSSESAERLLLSQLTIKSSL